MKRNEMTGAHQSEGGVLIASRAAGEGGGAGGVETGRDRVRRLLIGPLQEGGMRFRKGTKDERALLDQMADDLAYMSDEELVNFRIFLRTKGQGRERCFWPVRVAILGWAEDGHPRPLDELPSLLRWFASEAGQRAADEGRLVAEYWFWTKKKRPPVKAPLWKAAQEWKLVNERAAVLARKLERLEDREARGVLDDPADLAWLSAYRARREYVAGLVAGKGAE